MTTFIRAAAKLKTHDCDWSKLCNEIQYYSNNNKTLQSGNSLLTLTFTSE